MKNSPEDKQERCASCGKFKGLSLYPPDSTDNAYLFCGECESFDLEDGSRFYHDPVQGQVFLHPCECLRAQGGGATTFPQPPPVIKAIARARDRRAAFESVYSGGNLDLLPY